MDLLYFIYDEYYNIEKVI